MYVIRKLAENLLYVIDGSNPCSEARCTQLCLLKPDNEHTCSCKEGFSVDTDGRSCVGKFSAIARAGKQGGQTIACEQALKLN